MKEQEQKIRSFIALDIGEDVRQKLNDLQGRLKLSGSEVKWVKTGGIHCTLRFLGDISTEEIEMVHQAMIEAASGRIPFEVEVKGLGMFPNLRRPRVVWAGIERGKDEVAKIFEALEKGLEARGFGPADRAFKAHLTLGRIKSPRGIEKLLEAIELEKNHTCGAFAVDRLTLFRSQLNPAGAIYSVLQEAPFWE